MKKTKKMGAQKSQRELSLSYFKTKIVENFSPDELIEVHARIDNFSDNDIDLLKTFGNMAFIFRHNDNIKMAEIRLI